jgi:hypothetical protein
MGNFKIMIIRTCDDDDDDDDEEEEEEEEKDESSHCLLPSVVNTAWICSGKPYNNLISL